MPGLGIEIAVVNDTATPAIKRLVAGMAPDRLFPIIGRSARNTYREHLFGINGTKANALGGSRTNFYTAAARATQFRVEGDSVIVSINQVGIALRYFGGTVRPRTKKYLTIPAIPEAHGKRASEFSGLFFSFEYNPKLDARVPALVEGARSLLKRRSSKNGVKTFFAGVQNRRVVFWLVKQTTHQPDPSVLPYPELVEARVVRDVEAYTKLLLERDQPPAGGDN